jgi:hypothetical protein
MTTRQDMCDKIIDLIYKGSGLTEPHAIMQSATDEILGVVAGFIREQFPDWPESQLVADLIQGESNG